jgi:hypothetical protein
MQCNKNERFDLLLVSIGILILIENAAALKIKGKLFEYFVKLYIS